MEKLQVAKVFGNHMVLQYGMPLKVWGTGPDGVQVTVSLQNQTLSTFVEEGKWEITFLPLHLGDPIQMHIASATETITLNDLLIGDVYLAGGQSNMAMPLREVEGGQEELAAAHFPQIRVCDMVARHYETDTCYLGGNDEMAWEAKSSDLVWKVAQGNALKNFSAIGYYFAKEIHTSQHIPIGIINCNWGGKSASCWMREAYFKKNKKLARFYHAFQKQLANVNMLDYTKDFTEYALNVQHYLHGETNLWPEEPFGPLCSEIPGRLYESMLSRILPFTLKGVIWYQGESDELRYEFYEELFTALIENWREDFQNPNLPFFFVQLPNYAVTSSEDPFLWGYMRQAQFKVSQKVPHTYMAVTLDVGEANNIHPTNKRTVAHRLALLARQALYHEDLVANSPVLKAATYEKGKLILYFSHIGSGLIINGSSLKGLKLLMTDGRYIEVSAMIDGNRLYIHCPSVRDVKEVRYGYESNCICNLMSQEALPVTPFKAVIQ